MDKQPFGNYVDTVRQGVLNWLETIRDGSQGWGRWKYHAAMVRPWGLQSSGAAIELLQRLGALEEVESCRKQEAIAFLQSCQDPEDHLFKDPLETEADRFGEHTWPQIWGQRNGSTLRALEILGAKPLLPQARAQFADLGQVDGYEWTLSLDWGNPWKFGESWARAISAFLRSDPGRRRGEEGQRLEGLFRAMETEVLDPDTGMPTRRGCAEDPARAMAGLFKIMHGYLEVSRPVPQAERAIDSTLALQFPNGEFGYRRNMCMNWDALWVLRELDRQLGGKYRHRDIVQAAQRTCQVLLEEYRREDGAFAFHGDHCTVNHHSIRLCPTPLAISDILGTSMVLYCLEYADAWQAAEAG